MNLMQSLPEELDSVISQCIDRPVLLIDGETTEVISINKAGMEFFKAKDGLSGVEWPGILNLLDLSADTDLQVFQLPAVKSRAGPLSIEVMKYVGRDDSVEHYLEFHFVRPSDDGSNWAIIIVDKTDVEHYMQSRSDFVTMASHQLRTPLAGIKWSIDLFLEQYGSGLDAEQIHMLDNAAKSVTRMNELIKALLQLSRIESDSLELKPRPVEVHKLLQDVVRAHHLDAGRRSIQLITSFHQNLPEVILDGTLIGYVFENLISNAIKYSRDHSEITIFLSKLEGMLLLQVTDSGIGIPEDHQKKIFEKFYRDQNAVQFVPDGTGLGLYLCRVIAHRSGGEIWFKSEENKGSTFWFTIPIKQDKIAVNGDDKPKI